MHHPSRPSPRAAVRRRRARRQPLELGHLRLGLVHPLLHLLLLGAHVLHHLALAHPRVDLRREGDVAEQKAVADPRASRRAHVEHAVPLPQHPEHARLVRHRLLVVVHHRHPKHGLLLLRSDAVDCAAVAHRLASAAALGAHQLARARRGGRQREAHAREAADGVQLDGERGQLVLASRRRLAPPAERHRQGGDVAVQAAASTGQVWPVGAARREAEEAERAESGGMEQHPRGRPARGRRSAASRAEHAGRLEHVAAPAVELEEGVVQLRRQVVGLQVERRHLGARGPARQRVEVVALCARALGVDAHDSARGALLHPGRPVLLAHASRLGAVRRGSGRLERAAPAFLRRTRLSAEEGERSSAARRDGAASGRAAGDRGAEESAEHRCGLLGLGSVREAQLGGGGHGEQLAAAAGALLAQRLDKERLARQRVHRLHPLQRRRVRLCRQHAQRHLRLGEVSGSSRRHTRVERPWPRRRPRAARPGGGGERGQVGHILAHRPQSAVGRRQHQAAVGQQDPRPLAHGGPAALAAPVRRRLGQSVLAPRCAARRSSAREAGALTAAPSSDDALGQASARRRLALAEDAASQQVWRGRRQRRTVPQPLLR
mmetsp:Transcript_16645/g.48202  ORF Transcript_16645/g.48202 Transcript_16645/m.48202 type:complete len:605 (+) Transcript_16645:273-2087(+)